MQLLKGGISELAGPLKGSSGEGRVGTRYPLFLLFSGRSRLRRSEGRRAGGWVSGNAPPGVKSPDV